MTADTSGGATDAARLNLIVGRLMRTIRQHGAAGLSPSQVSALVTVEERGPLRISSLASLESLGAPAATRVVATLEELGLVSRSCDPEDKRAFLIAVTVQGAKTLQLLRHERTLGLDAQLEALPTADRRALVRALPVLERIAQGASR